MKYIIFILLFFMSACCGSDLENAFKGTKRDFYLDLGFQVITNGNKVYPAQIEEAIKVVTEKISKRSPDIYNEQEIFEYYKNNDTIVYVRNKPWDCRQLSGSKCGGIFSRPNVIFYAKDKCIGKSSFPHELIHLLGFVFDNNSYSNHSKKYFKSENSVEVKSEEKLKDTICPCPIF